MAEGTDLPGGGPGEALLCGGREEAGQQTAGGQQVQHVSSQSWTLRCTTASENTAVPGLLARGGMSAKISVVTAFPPVSTTRSSASTGLSQPTSSRLMSSTAEVLALSTRPQGCNPASLY